VICTCVRVVVVVTSLCLSCVVIRAYWNPEALERAREASSLSPNDMRRIMERIQRER
jgi:hypothetical protein